MKQLEESADKFLPHFAQSQTESRYPRCINEANLHLENLFRSNIDSIRESKFTDKNCVEFGGQMDEICGKVIDINSRYDSSLTGNAQAIPTIQMHASLLTFHRRLSSRYSVRGMSLLALRPKDKWKLHVCLNLDGFAKALNL